jgi:sarcosine oxidase
VRVLIVGGGVIGLLTAVECARAGVSVTVVDRAAIPSPRATSNDTQRVVRALHRGDAALTEAGARTWHAWLDVEELLGMPFMHQVGALTAMPPGETAAALGMLTGARAAAAVLTAGNLAACYPAIRFPAEAAAVLEPAAGVVQAGQALTAMARWLGRQRGVRLCPHRQVVGLRQGAVRLANGELLTGDRVVLAAGPWSGDLLPAAVTTTLTLHRQTVLSYAPRPSRSAWAGTPAIPALGTSHGAWLIPPVGDAPVRLSAASACRAVTGMTGDYAPTGWQVHLARQFSMLIADFEPSSVIGASDGYYLAHDGDPLFVLLAGDELMAYAACGGSSFKFAPLIARAIAARAVGLTPPPSGLASVDRPQVLAGAYDA